MKKLVLTFLINLIIFHLKTFALKDQNYFEPNHVEISNLEFKDNSYNDPVICHRLALSNCGHTFIKIFKYLDYLSPKEAFYSKCAFKNAFYNCLKKTKIKACIFTKRLHRFEKLKTKLAKNLWSTKSCLADPLNSLMPEKRFKAVKQKEI